MAGVLGSPQTPDVGQELSLGIMTALPPFFFVLLFCLLWFIFAGFRYLSVKREQ